MKILLDADGSPVREITEKLCQKYGAKLLMVKNYSQDFSSIYGEVISVDISKEAADIYIANHAKSGDLVITNDKGLSSLGLSKNARVMDFQGNFIDDDNIVAMLESRHFNKKMRERQVYFNIAKRDVSADYDFYKALEKFLEENKMLTLFVSSLCPDCPPAIAEVKEKNLDCEIVDITESMANLKRFLKERDLSEDFDEIVEKGNVGVPALMRDDKFYFFDGNLDEFLEG
ncbi:DUF188 domain-containing protein [uncultured Peptoniphilus sp.]|uniref:DUF188 domain-containing protein n=1 Tax=uncultured Peptoniphilus sp. TaxID=254354 RepID=UPI0025904E9E|nr:DUF188 domain-containing protein [uncultured Peptoniphilus sp.]MDU1582535.1 DUF188 domain-containing protein [Peptoniphilus harei]MDU1664298.1 DUF188 domain-containing protein [Peptoniphilus harei]MDU6784004.1 DUF188 domain-containing protein [Peptoniphilus harei]